MEMNYIREGSGEPLVLIHGLGSSWRTWEPVLDELAGERDVIALDLPGHGESSPLPGAASIETLADAVGSFLEAMDLDEVDVVGNSMGGRLVLELARRRDVGATVALDPGGFWEGWERYFFYGTLAPSIRLVRALDAALPEIAASPAGRSLLFAQFSAHPSEIPVSVARDELESFADTSSFDELLSGLAFGPEQRGAASTPGPVVLGWGRKDRVTLPRQAARAMDRFPHARLHWFEDAGHYPHWDVPGEVVELILDATGRAEQTTDQLAG